MKITVETRGEHSPSVRCGARGGASHPKPEGFPIIKSILSQFHQFQYDITPCIGNFNSKRSSCRNKFFNSIRKVITWLLLRMTGDGLSNLRLKHFIHIDKLIFIIT